MNEVIKINSSADLNKLKNGNNFHVLNAYNYSEFHIGRYNSKWFDNQFTIGQVGHIYFQNSCSTYVSKDYLITSTNTILLNITFINNR